MKDLFSFIILTILEFSEYFPSNIRTLWKNFLNRVLSDGSERGLFMFRLSSVSTYKDPVDDVIIIDKDHTTVRQRRY